MAGTRDHIIQKQKIEIGFESLDDAVGIQNRIAEVFYERLQPRMALLFDEMVGEKYIATIDRLEIDAGVLSNEKWEEEWVENVLHKLKEELQTIDKRKINVKTHDHSLQVKQSQNDIPGKKMEEEIDTKNITQSFFFFLRHGHLPWNARIRSLDEIEKIIVVDKGLVIRLMELFSKQRQSAKRLALQFTENFRRKIIEILVPEEQLLSIAALLQPIKFGVDKRITDAAILYAFSIRQQNNVASELLSFVYNEVEENKKREIKKILEQVAAETSAENEKSLAMQQKRSAEKEKDIKQPGKTKEEDEAEEQQDIYINNAGLIILHPFLPQLFEELGLLKENSWMDDEAPQRAVSILEFIAQGGEDFSEFNLPLNKILCGIEPGHAIRALEELNSDAKTICNNLLEEIIKHWSVLKSTGVEALRQTFLQRKGKLVPVDNGWLLQVEQNSFDILLASLPWGIGFIKLPWMQEQLFTEW